MGAAQAIALPAYVGQPPVRHSGVVIGLEHIGVVWPELTELGKQEWGEVGDSNRLGDFNPDFVGSVRFEMAGRLALITVREFGEWELVGYWVGTLGESLKQKGKTCLTETGVYLTKDRRDPFTARRLLAYVEGVAKRFGADAVICSHRPDNMRIGRLYERAGYTPLSVDYIKEIRP